MARFDVHAYPSGDGYLLDVQADLLDHLNTRVVVPLLAKATAPKPASRLNPVFEICLLYTSPSPRDRTRSRMPSSA